MLSEKETTRRSKLLSLVLRHNPAHLGITLDEQGWTDVARLLAQLPAHGQPLSPAEVACLVETSSKQLFRFSDDRTRIRASQGHSVEVLGYVPVVPPEVLYYSTAAPHQAAIAQQGRRRMSWPGAPERRRGHGARGGRPARPSSGIPGSGGLSAAAGRCTVANPATAQEQSFNSCFCADI